MHSLIEKKGLWGMRQIRPLNGLEDDLKALGLTESDLGLRKSEVPILKMNLFTPPPLVMGEEKISGGKGDGRPDSDYDEEELKRGIAHEMEHSNDSAIAKEIAKDHLSENPRYYSELSKANID